MYGLHLVRCHVVTSNAKHGNRGLAWLPYPGGSAVTVNVGLSSRVREILRARGRDGRFNDELVDAGIGRLEAVAGEGARKVVLLATC